MKVFKIFLEGTLKERGETQFVEGQSHILDEISTYYY
jgi:hypothetical protein